MIIQLHYCINKYLLQVSIIIIKMFDKHMYRILKNLCSIFQFSLSYTLVATLKSKHYFIPFLRLVLMYYIVREKAHSSSHTTAHFNFFLSKGVSGEIFCTRLNMRYDIAQYIYARRRKNEKSTKKLKRINCQRDFSTALLEIARTRFL